MGSVQKVVLPAQKHAWLVAGRDDVCGYVLKTEDVAWADTPEKLYRAHGLAFPGSPVPPGTPFIDVVRMPVTFAMSIVAATGGNDAATAARLGGRFVDRPPFTGNGFVKGVDGFLPLWWLDPVRVPAGSEIWRVHADTRQELVAIYPHVGIGWTLPEGVTASAPIGSGSPSDMLGVFLLTGGARMPADLLPTGGVLLCAPEPQGPEWQRGPRGLWFTELDAAESAEVVGEGRLISPRLCATWRGLPFQLIARAAADPVQLAAIYLGGDADLAEAAGLIKTDAGVYRAIVPREELSDLQGVEVSPARPSDGIQPEVASRRVPPRRDPRVDGVYFDTAVESKGAAVERARRKLLLPPEQRRTPDLVAVAANEGAINSDLEFSVRYSRGDDLRELRATFDRWLDLAELAALEKRAGLAERLVAAQDKPGGVYLLYMQRLRLLGIAHALAVDGTTFARVVTAVEQLRGDRLVSHLVAARIAGTEVSTIDWQPRMRPLADVFDAPAERRPALIAAFLAKRWYPAMKGLPWYDGHPYLNHGSYAGYWAFEVAGVVAALGIEQGSFRGQEYFPAGIVLR